eukprot:jgi/Tetstr1/430665/TSEL_020458.t1
MQHLLIEPTAPGPFRWPDVPRGKVSHWLRGRFGGGGHGEPKPPTATDQRPPAQRRAADPAPPSPASPPKEVDPSLPCIFDEFELSEEQLGAGASSVVVRARAKGGSGQQLYAVKIITLDGHYSEADAAEEFALQQRLKHPRLATALGAYRGDPGKYYLLFELLEGGSLKELPQLAAEADVARIMAGVFGALSTLHREKLIHCDVKLENLILQTPGDFSSVRLTDFGLCHDMRKGFWGTTASGTPSYFAPELVRVFRRERGAVFGQHVDVWAAGVVLHQLLSGEMPFDGMNFKSLFQQIDDQPVAMSGPAWAGVSEEAKDLVRRCLTRDFHARLSARDAARHPWLRPYLDKRPSSMDTVRKILGRISPKLGSSPTRQ